MIVELCLVSSPSQPEERFGEFRTGLDHLEFVVATRDQLDHWAHRLDQLGIAHSGVKAPDYTVNPMITFRGPDNIHLEFFWPALIPLVRIRLRTIMSLDDRLGGTADCRAREKGADGRGRGVRHYAAADRRADYFRSKYLARSFDEVVADGVDPGPDEVAAVVQGRRRDHPHRSDVPTYGSADECQIEVGAIGDDRSRWQERK
jgi:hypothetical protein